ncbi:geranylgeranyl reductase family protein [Shimia sp. R9_3]|uniref:geranylgeranyl reductase family protein n=1 Tax=Shimia sp. R9_3 TaxID=2821113 RepID=UPI001ADD143B|nr:geranylgeranyl reductase family protein [Shimia sp. R9_3]MBO9400458.1 geranylgeranyl reductase family protein [Shimia sp. R9_3]
MTEFDIIIIGAGPAGSAAAAWAARQGQRVALVDKSRFPRSKLCGGLFTERSRSYFREIFCQDPDLSQAVTRHDCALWYQGAELAKLEDIPPLHLTMRLDIDAQMFGHALAAGAVDFTSCPVATLTDSSVTFRDGETLTCRVLIGADGVSSIVAKHLFGAAFDTKTIGFGLEIEAPLALQDPQSQPLRIDFAAAQWGYGWSFPKQGSTTVGIGGLRAENPDMKARMATYLTTLGLPTDAVKVKGHHLPFGDFRPHPGRASVLLAGDAAGLVDPITGEGIAFAMKSGQLAAQAACDALAAQAPETALARYQKALKDMHRNLRIARALRHVIFGPRWQKTLMASFRRSGTMRMMYMQLLAGQVEYPELARRLLLRLPKYLLTALRPSR